MPSNKFIKPEIPADLVNDIVLLQLKNDGLNGQELGTAIASLILLRWIEYKNLTQSDTDAFILPIELSWSHLCTLSAEAQLDLLTKKLPEYINKLDSEYPHIITNHLHELSTSLTIFQSTSSSALNIMVHWLKIIDISFDNLVDRKKLLVAFDDILENSNDPRSGWNLTPKSIRKLMVKLASPSITDHAYDPCFSSAGFLTSIVDSFNENKIEITNTISISGNEIVSNHSFIGLVRLILSGVENPQLKNSNSLTEETTDESSFNNFDLVLSNPPFGQRVAKEIASNFAIQTKNIVGLYVQHALKNLKTGGKALFVVPQGFLFNSNKPDLELRKMLVQEHTVEAIIDLPTGVFHPYTGIKTSIISIIKGGQTINIRMADASSIFHVNKGRTATLIRNDLTDDFINKVHSKKASKNCWDVSLDSIIESNWDFTPRRRDESNLENIFSKLSKSIDISTLKECAQIRSGKNVKSQYLFNSPSNESSVSYIRIKDIQVGKVFKGTSWLSDKVIPPIENKDKLNTDDILLSKSGTIGKIGIISNAKLNAVAANGLYILKPNKVTIIPEYLVAYLNSIQCNTWLNDHATGGAIKSLTVSVLQKLPIPLPTLEVQKLCVELYQNHKIDVISYLTSIHTGINKTNNILYWIDKTLSVLRGDADNIQNPFDKRILNQIEDFKKFTIGDFDQLMKNLNEQPKTFPIGGDKLESKQIMYKSFGEWFFGISGNLKLLYGLSKIPKGPVLLSILNESINGLEKVENKIDDKLANESNARLLTVKLISWINKGIKSLYEKTSINISSNIDILNLNDLTDIEVIISNNGFLPIRDLKIASSPNFGNFTIGYLAEKSSSTFFLNGKTPTVLDVLNIKINWQCHSLNGQLLKGSSELAFNVVESKDSSEQLELIGSPYVCGAPVNPKRSDVFYGRDELLNKIKRHIIRSGNVILLEGNRRSGKTSILTQIEGENKIPGWLGIYCSLQGAGGSADGVGVPTVEIFREMAKAIAKGVHSLKIDTPLPDDSILPSNKKMGIPKACKIGITEESPFSDFRDYAEVILELLEEKNLKLLLMMDEFDKLQEGIDNGITSPQVPENIRFLVQTYPEFSAILTGSRRLQRLREEYWSALFGLGIRIGVTSLDKKDAIKLITLPVKQDNISYSNEAVDKIYQLTSGQPFLLQSLCNRIYDIVAQYKKRSINLDMVIEASDNLIEDNEHFASLWNYAGSDRRRYILALFRKDKDNTDSLHINIIQTLLSDNQIEVHEDDLIKDIEFLRELELVDLISDKNEKVYKLSLPLMEKWIDKQQDLVALKSKAINETEEQND